MLRCIDGSQYSAASGNLPRDKTANATCIPIATQLISQRNILTRVRGSAFLFLIFLSKLVLDQNTAEKRWGCRDKAYIMSLVSIRKKGYLHKLPVKGIVKVSISSQDYVMYPSLPSDVPGFRNGTSVGLCCTALPSKASCDWSTSTTKALR